MAGPSCSRPPASRRPLWRAVAGLAAVLSLALSGGLLAPAPAQAQTELTFPQRPAKPKS